MTVNMYIPRCVETLARFFCATTLEYHPEEFEEFTLTEKYFGYWERKIKFTGREHAIAYIQKMIGENHDRQE